jgi:hypothetical protein
MTLKEFFGPLGRWWTGTKEPTPTAGQIAHASLEQARIDRLEHAKNAEYHEAMDEMLKKRIARLRLEVKESVDPADQG